MTRALIWVGTEVIEPPSFYGQNDLEEFLTRFKLEFFESQRLPILDIALKSKPTRWWGTHNENILNWYQCKRLLHIRFNAKYEDIYVEKYDGMRQPREYIEICITQWVLVPP